MAQNDFTEDKATLFGAGMVTVGVFGKTALITKGVGVVAATKAGVLSPGQSIHFRIPHICHVESGMIKKFYVIICGFLRKGKNKI